MKTKSLTYMNKKTNQSKTIKKNIKEIIYNKVEKLTDLQFLKVINYWIGPKQLFEEFSNSLEIYENDEKELKELLKIINNI